jgi:hypothetical protein
MTLAFQKKKIYLSHEANIGMVLRQNTLIIERGKELPDFRVMVNFSPTLPPPPRPLVPGEGGGDLHELFH